AHVQFIDDRLDGTDAGRLVVAPVECVVDDQAASGAAPAARGNAPAGATRQRLGVGIQELPPGIEALQVRGRVGDPIHAVRILDAGSEPLQEGVPDLTRPMEAAVEGKLHDGILLARDEDQERNGGGIAARHGEVDPVRPYRRPQGHRTSPAEFDVGGETPAQAMWIHTWSTLLRNQDTRALSKTSTHRP